MATRQRASKARQDRRPSASSAPRQAPLSLEAGPPGDVPSADVYGVPVPESLHEAIELERDNLSKVEALLACMATSMECQSNLPSSPHYPDVVQVARELVERTIDGLDPFTLKRRLLNKVEDEFCMPAHRTYAELHRLDSRQVLIGSFAPCG